MGTQFEPQSRELLPHPTLTLPEKVNSILKIASRHVSRYGTSPVRSVIAQPSFRKSSFPPA